MTVLPQLERAEPHWLIRQNELTYEEVSLQPSAGLLHQQQQLRASAESRRSSVEFLPQEQPQEVSEMQHHLNNTNVSSEPSPSTRMEQLQQAESMLQQ